MGLCLLWHTWITVKRETTSDKLGPFDPRTDEERTFVGEWDICAVCGKTRRTPCGGFC